MQVRDDPTALRSPAMCRFFARVMRRQMARSFRAVLLKKPGLPQIGPDRPLVIYSNHPGWWDPALYMVLQTSLFPDREGYGPMEAQALERYRFMKRIGIFGVDPGTRAGAARFLKVGTHVLSDPRRCLWMTAQGRFADPRERPATLRPGLAHLMARIPGAVAVPLAIEYPFWSERRPEALCGFGTPVENRQDAAAWHGALEHALGAAQDDLASAAMDRDPAAFDTILGGARGVGGVYGAWSRMRAIAAGRRYDPDHVTR